MHQAMLLKPFKRLPLAGDVNSYTQATIPGASGDQLNPSLSGTFSSHHRRSSPAQRAGPGQDVIIRFSPLDAHIVEAQGPFEILEQGKNYIKIHTAQQGKGYIRLCHNGQCRSTEITVGGVDECCAIDAFFYPRYKIVYKTSCQAGIVFSAFQGLKLQDAGG